MEPVDVVRQAWELTRDAGCAHHEYAIDDDYAGFFTGAPRWLRITRWLWRRLSPSVELSHVRARGVIEFGARPRRSAR